MKPVMKVRVTEPVHAAGRPPGLSYQGVVEMPNFAPTKLRKEDGGTIYATVSNLRQAAVAAAKKYNATLAFVVPTKKVAAKKSATR